MDSWLRNYDYHLPRELIAQRPLPHRERSRMMVVRRDLQSIEHATFSDPSRFIQHDHLLVLNNSRVLAARHFSDDGAVEFLFVRRISPGRWKALVRPGRRFRRGWVTSIHGVRAIAGEIDEQGMREIVLDQDTNVQTTGVMPLPPYISRLPEKQDALRYQTVFACEDGSIAAPTAGLHFTAEILGALPHTFITLHVGIGTFRPVKSENILDHTMHEEQFSISPASAAAINEADKIVAVGTTSVRVLESVQRQFGEVRAVEGATNIFIHPPFEFRVVDALLTNFHLPRSTLLMLVSAFAGRELILRAYAEAVRQRYRFFSYGDCMLVL